jgi:hypothetical protein
MAADAQPFLVNEEEASDSVPSSFLLSSYISCGLLETRFALTCVSFFIVLLFWAQQGVLGLVAVALVTAVIALALLRIVLLARYKPTALYDIAPAEDNRDQQQQGARSAQQQHSRTQQQQRAAPRPHRCSLISSLLFSSVQGWRSGPERCSEPESDSSPSRHDGPRLHSQRLRAAAGTGRRDEGQHQQQPQPASVQSILPAGPLTCAVSPSLLLAAV